MKEIFDKNHFNKRIFKDYKKHQTVEYSGKKYFTQKWRDNIQHKHIRQKYIQQKNSRENIRDKHIRQNNILPTKIDKKMFDKNFTKKSNVRRKKFDKYIRHD